MKNIAKFGIPLQALAVVATTLGCNGDDGDPMVGSFECTYFAYDGQRTNCPYTDTYEDGGVTYEVFNTLYLTVGETGSGTLRAVRELKGDGVVLPEYSYDDDFAMTGTMIAEGEWDFSVPTFAGGLEMNCTAVGDVATCLGTIDGDVDWEVNWSKTGGTDEYL